MARAGADARRMAHEPRPHADPLPEPGPELMLVEGEGRGSRWVQPRDPEGAYVPIARRSLPSLTSLRFFAAIYVVIHHLVNVGLLWSQGADADRSATWYLAWGTQGHVGVTFFFVLSGFILAWCYHEVLATVESGRLRATATRFWRARFARVWPLHAAMFFAVAPITLVGIAGVRDGLTAAWQGLLNVMLLHAWIPTGSRDGLAQTFNGPSWTLSCEAFFYAIFPLLAVVLLRRLRWGIAQLAILAGTAWLTLGAIGLAVGTSDTAIWMMHVFPIPRAVDFVVGVCLGLAVVQLLQHRVLANATAVQDEPTTARWTALEAVVLAAAAASPLLWAVGAHEVLPETLGSSWFHLPPITAAIGLMAFERGAISRRLLAWSPLIWLGEVSYALYLTHMPLLVVAYRAGVYDLLGLWPTTLLLLVVSIALAGVVHKRFEQPMRARLTRRRTVPAAA